MHQIFIRINKIYQPGLPLSRQKAELFFNTSRLLSAILPFLRYLDQAPAFAQSALDIGEDQCVDGDTDGDDDQDHRYHLRGIE
jgi:hypothetical protein